MQSGNAARPTPASTTPAARPSGANDFPSLGNAPAREPHRRAEELHAVSPNGGISEALKAANKVYSLSLSCRIPNA